MVLEAVATTDGARGVEIEAARAGGEAAEQGPFWFGQQRVRPVDGSPQGLLAPYCGAGAASEEPEAIMQPRDDLGG